MTPRRTTDLTHTLVAGLKEMIVGGRIQPGVRLPPERELAKQFGVNRASIRQALKALDIMGVVYQRVGDGTYLTPNASSTLSVPLEFLILVDGISFQELLEARLIVEPELAARAAKRATEEDLVDLEKVLLDVESAIATNACDLAAHDLHFHEVIWRISGNRVCERMFAAIHHGMSQFVAVTSLFRDEDSPVVLHRRIVEAIHRHDEAAARREMHHHLLGAARILHQAGNTSSAVPDATAELVPG